MVGAKVCELTDFCGLYVVCMWFVCLKFDVSPIKAVHYISARNLSFVNER